MRFTLAAALIFALIGIGCEAPKYTEALEPEEALKSFNIREGFRIELFAAEPFVQDPVEMVFDENGNAFVVEMPDYPFKPEPGQGAGRIKVLQDTNADGRVDRSIVFADSMSEATSLLPWRQGLLVAVAPYILYLKDTNSDFVADTKEILFSGFFANNSEAQITSLRLGVDNWIYAANNGQAGEVTYHRRPDIPPLRMNGGDFRFRLDTDEFELEAGAAQFGHTMDDWGNRFITQNTLHIRQVVIPWRYLHRHEHLVPSTSIVNISDHDLEMYQETPPPYWRAERTRRRQKQYQEQNLDRKEYAEDHFTGCSGGTIYYGNAFPSEYYGNVFTGDVAGNLVHRDILIHTNDHPALVAKRGEDEKNSEFLTSDDPWFRPANFTIGPDGSLFVIDMYRQHIETPLSIPEDLKADMDFLNGSDRGRIYRIVPENFAKDRAGATPAPGNKSSTELIQLLGHPNRWWRMQAQRLILDRGDRSVIPAITSLLQEHDDALVRLHSLYILEGLGALNASLVSKVLSDPHPGMRKHGLILAEQYPELRAQVLEHANDSSIQVVFQVALSAGQFEGTEAAEILLRILALYGDDPLFRTAVLSAPATADVDFLDKVILHKSFLSDVTPWKLSLVEALSYAIGSAAKPRDVDRLLEILSASPMVTEPRWQLAGVNGLKEGLQRSAGTNSSDKKTLETIKTNNTSQVQDALRMIRSIDKAALK